MQKVPSGLFTAESSRSEVMGRILSDASNIDSRNISTGYLRTADFHSMTEAAGKLYEAPLYIYDEPNMSLGTLINQARYMVNRYGVKIIFIDYAQILEYNDRNLQERERYAKISMSLKKLSRQLEIPVVSSAQLGRDSDGKRPTLKDFDGSSQFEKDADSVILLYHKKHDERGKMLPEEQHKSYFLIDKNRDGPVGVNQVYFDKKHVRFREVENE